MTEAEEAVLEHQLQQGVAVSSVRDGTLIFLSKDALVKLLAKCEETGQTRVVFFAQKQVGS